MISHHDIEAMCDKAPYFKFQGDLILEDGMGFIDAEQYIFNKLDEAAAEGDWDTYQKLTVDLDRLEENYCARS